MKNLKLVHILVILFMTIIVMPSMNIGCRKEKLKGFQGLEYKEIDGTDIKLEDCFGKKVTLIFNYCLWDPVSVQELRILSEIHGKYHDLGLCIISFVYEETDLEKIQKAKRSESAEFPFFLADSRAVELFGDEELVPGLIVLDGKKEIVRRIKGYIDKENLEKYLREFLDVTQM